MAAKREKGGRERKEGRKEGRREGSEKKVVRGWLKSSSRVPSGIALWLVNIPETQEGREMLQYKRANISVLGRQT